MIRFACPHCGKQYTVDDKLSGRHGWCALCMGLLAVPDSDDPEHSRELTPEEKLECLRGLLKAAEDRFKIYKERFKKTDQLARALYQKRKALEDDLNERGERIASQTGRIEEALAQTERLTQALAASAKAQGEAETLLARTQEDLCRLQSELQAERQARILAEEAQRERLEVSATAEAEERHAALESEIARLGRELDAERTARTAAERDRQAAQVLLAGLDGQLRQTEEELDRLRQQAARGQALELEAAKSECEKELRATQALREAERHRARTEAVESAVAEAERAFMEATARAERLTEELESTRTGLEQARKEAQNSAELELGLRVSQARAEELQQVNEVLASELSLAARTAGAAEARIKELSRELEGLARDLEQERSLRLEAEDRAREMSAEAKDVEERALTGPVLSAMPPLETDGAIVTLVPELVDAPDADDLMMETLLRFIEPE